MQAKRKKIAVSKNRENMKIKLLLITLSIIVLNSCVNYEKYDSAVNTILQNYGGEIVFGPGVGTNTTKGKYNYLSVELNESQFLQYGIHPNNVITHTATEFAKYTSDEISEIQIEINSQNANGEIQNFSETVTIEEAKLIISKENILHNCIEKIAAGDVNNLKLIFTDEYKLQFDNNNIETTIKEVKEILGTYKGSMFRGYEIMGNDSIPDKDFIMLNGLILGSKENVILSVVIDPEINNEKSIVSLRI